MSGSSHGGSLSSSPQLNERRIYSSHRYDTDESTHHTNGNGHMNGNNHMMNGLSLPQSITLELEDHLWDQQAIAHLTPRSLEACRMQGVIPQELVLKTYDTFESRGVPPSIQKLRYQDYEATRQETLAAVRAQRADLITAGWQQKSPISQRTSQRSLTKSGSAPALTWNGTNGSTSEDEDIPALLALEQQRMEKIMTRQNKELESMMAYELKVAQMVQKQEMKLQARLAKEEAENEMRREDRARAAEKRRLWQLTHAAEEEKQRQAKLEAQQKLYQQEYKHLRDQQRRRLEEQRENRIRSEERRRKRLEAEQRAEEQAREQAEMLRAKEREMEERDEMRRQALEEKKRQLSELHHERTLQAQARVQLALQSNNKMLEQKKALLEHRLHTHHLRMDAFEKMKQEIQQEKMEAQKERDSKRVEAYKQAVDQGSYKIEDINQKLSKHDQLAAQIAAQKRERSMLKNELRRLNDQKKQQNVERLKRKQEYARQHLLHKIEEDERRGAEIEQQRQMLLLERQRNKIALQQQKRNMIQMFNKMKYQRKWEDLSQTGLVDASHSPHPSDLESQLQPSLSATSPPGSLLDALQSFAHKKGKSLTTLPTEYVERPISHHAGRKMNKSASMTNVGTTKEKICSLP